MVYCLLLQCYLLVSGVFCYYERVNTRCETLGGQLAMDDGTMFFLFDVVDFFKLRSLALFKNFIIYFVLFVLSLEVI